MTICQHAATRLNQYLITQNMIDACIKNGQIIILENNRVKVQDNLICLIFERDILVTAHYNNRVTNYINNFAKYNNISRRAALRIYLKEVC